MKNVSDDQLVNVLVDIAEGSETNNIGVVVNNTNMRVARNFLGQGNILRIRALR